LVDRRTSRQRGAQVLLSNLPADTPIKTLASTIKARWICEQAHQQLKEELGLDHFEGRSWQGLHRHALMTNDRLHLPPASPPRNREAGKKSHRTTATAKLTSGASYHHRAYDLCMAPAMPALPQMAQLGMTTPHVLPK
jgi:SRSO17 transposase